MLVKKIKYEDYDGNEREEEFYFHLTQAEVIMWLTTNGGYTLDKVIDQISKAQNGRKIMEMFEDLLHKSYGVKSLDGRKFIKNEEVWTDFKETEAYSQIFSEIVTDSKKAVEFLNGILPKDLGMKVNEMMRKNPTMYKEYLEAASN